jgi:hypothetical protein
MTIEPTDRNTQLTHAASPVMRPQRTPVPIRTRWH